MSDLPSLSDRLGEMLAPRPAPRCHACHVLGQLTGDDRAMFQRALDGRVGASTLALTMREYGHLLPEAHVRRHRNEQHGS